ncbi:MAG: dockerin type I domain-containing protein [Planctomycetota bacterium]|jgi:hypothetical protein
MRKVIVIAVLTMGLFKFVNSVYGDVSLIRNGSFESDGVINNIAVQAPDSWCDVNVPAEKFAGWVDTDWSTHGYAENYHSLTLSTVSFAEVETGDMMTVSQQVYLEDVNQIIFDLELTGTHSSFPWDPDKLSGLLLIDGAVVWDSNDLGPTAEGEYFDIAVDVNEIYRDSNSHTLSLAMRANSSEMHLTPYLVRWDFLKFDTHCGGFGYLPEDFNYDCFIDFRDFAMLGDVWMSDNPQWKYDLHEDGVIDNSDLMVFTAGWLDCSYWENRDANNCYFVELPAVDVDDSGQVDYGDVLILQEYWLAEGDCSMRIDINKDEVIDFKDFAYIADEWGTRSWLYGLD